MKIVEMRLTPVAFSDPPLRNSTGVHEPFAIRVIVELVTDDGLSGWGEAAGGEATVAALEAVREHVIGLDPFHREPLRQHGSTSHRLGSTRLWRSPAST
jgi:glucarate dehydratase